MMIYAIIFIYFIRYPINVKAAKENASYEKKK